MLNLCIFHFHYEQYFGRENDAVGGLVNEVLRDSELIDTLELPWTAL